MQLSKIKLSNKTKILFRFSILNQQNLFCWQPVLNKKKNFRIILNY